MLNIEAGRKTAVNLMIGTAIGAAAGSVFGVIFAPKPGKQTRQQLRTWLKEKGSEREGAPTQPQAEPNHWKEVVLDDARNGQSAAVNLAIGTAIGAVAGSVLGILFAPKAGQQTRQQVGSWLKQKRQSSSVLLTRISAEAKHRKEQAAAVWQAGRHAYAETARP